MKKILVSILVISFILTLSAKTIAESENEKKAEKYFKIACEYLKKGDYQRATLALNYITKKFPETKWGKKAKEKITPGAVLKFEPLRITGDDKNRMVIAILGDGYTNLFERRGDANNDGIKNFNEQALFDKDAKKAMNWILSKSPYKEYSNFINFYKINLISKQSSCDTKEQTRDTALDGKFVGKVMSVNWSKVHNITKDHVKADIHVVLVQRGEKGSAVIHSRDAVVGLRGVGPKTWGPKWGFMNLMHELGHAIGKCGDEYSREIPTAIGKAAYVEPSYPNVTIQTERDKIKWKHWIKKTNPIPTTGNNPKKIGLYEGALGHKKRFYRPAPVCTMKGSSWDYCAVCKEVIIKEMYEFVNLIEKSEPQKKEKIILSSKNSSVTLKIQILVPKGSAILLTYSFAKKGKAKKKPKKIVIKGQYLRKGFYIFKKKLSLHSLEDGEYEFKLKIKDLTPMVKHDPKNLLKASKNWEIVVKK